MDFLTVNFENEESILHSFDQIANKLSNDIIFKVNKSHYRIIDFEFYCYSEKFKDPHTYKNDLQLEKAKIYLHGSGIDITFGDGVNHGGILIRSVVKLYEGAENEEGFMKKQIDGPHKVATELFTGLHSLINPAKMNEIFLKDIEGYHFDSMFHAPITVLKTHRVGLTGKQEDPENKYMNLPLRYIVVLKKFPKFRQSIKGMERIVGDQVKAGKLTRQDAENILGYNRNF